MALLSFPARAHSQQASLDEARALLDRYEISESREVFISHGTESVEYIIALVRLDTYHDARAELLEGFLVKIPGPEVDATLIQLLTDPSPKIRGLIASVLGARRTRDAVRALVNCLSDLQETGLMLESTHSTPGRTAILVRDQAIRALERITDRSLQTSGTPEDKAKAWRVWWIENEAAWVRALPQ